jgi:beta-lactamase regulating signal transducer with metallopeptidase domain/methyl-accepting chemotaxis protein
MIQSLGEMTHRWWFEPMAILSLGPATIVTCAMLAAYVLKDARWHRTLWQGSLLGLLALIGLEVTGTGQGLFRVSGGGLMRHVTDLELAVPDESGAISAPGDLKTTSKWARSIDEPYLQESVLALPSITGLTPSLTDHGRRFRGATGTYRTAQTDGIEDLPAVESFTRERTLESPLWPTAAVSQGAGEYGDASTTAGEISLVVVWLLGSMLVMARVGWNTALLVQFRRAHPEAADPRLQQRVSRLSSQLAMRRQPELLVSDRLAVPVAFGIWRPTIILPESFATEFSAAQQETMLAHELAHLGAHDPAWKLVANLTCAALWWHPLVWHARRRFHAACESAADQASLLLPDGPDILADCLVRLGQRISYSKRLGWLSVAGEGFRSGLAQRVLRLLSLKHRKWHPLRPARNGCVVAFVLICLVLLAEAGTVWARPRVTSPSPTKGADMSILTTSWRQSLAATALLALLGPGSDVLADEGSREETVEVTIESEASDDGEEPVLASETEEVEVEEGEHDAPVVERRVVIRKEGPNNVIQEEEIIVNEKDDPRAAKEPREQKEREEETRSRLGKLLRVRDDLVRQLRNQRDLEGRRAVGERLGAIRREIAELNARRRAIGAERRGPLDRDQQNRLADLEKQIARIHLADQLELVGERDLGLQVRLEHMHAAAKNLDEAGLPDQADQVRRQAKQMEMKLLAGRGYLAKSLVQKEQAGQHGEQLEQAVRKLREQVEQMRQQEQSHVQGEQAAPHSEQLEQAVHELREQVEQMREEMQEVRHTLQTALERLEHNDSHEHGEDGDDGNEHPEDDEPTDQED